MTTEQELARAFDPCTVQGLVDEWNRHNREIGELRKNREPIARELLRLSVEGADMNVDPAFRKGIVLEGYTTVGNEPVRVQAIWHLYDDGKWLPKLEYVR